MDLLEIVKTASDNNSGDPNKSYWDFVKHDSAKGAEIGAGIGAAAGLGFSINGARHIRKLGIPGGNSAIFKGLAASAGIGALLGGFNGGAVGYSVGDFRGNLNDSRVNNQILRNQNKQKMS